MPRLTLVGLLAGPDSCGGGWGRWWRVTQAVPWGGSWAAVDGLVGVGGAVEAVVVTIWVVRRRRWRQAAWGLRGWDGQRWRRLALLGMIMAVWVWGAGRPARMFEGAMGAAAILLIHEPPIEWTPIRTVAQIHWAVTGRLNCEQGQVSAPKAVVPAFHARCATPAPAPILPAVLPLGHPPVLRPWGWWEGHSRSRLWGLSAGRALQREGWRGSAFVQIECDITEWSGSTVTLLLLGFTFFQSGATRSSLLAKWVAV